MTSIDELNAMDAAEFATAVAPLFEGAPRFIQRLASARPFESEDDMFDSARSAAREMPDAEQIELLDAHPRIGADAGAMSELSRREQHADGSLPGETAWIGEELTALNEAYEGRFGFRFVVFVAGRPPADIIPLLERALRADRDEELRRGLDDVVMIAAARMEALRGPRPLREEMREAIALEVSRWMVGEVDRQGFIGAIHRLVEEGVESPALLALSLADPEGTSDLAMPVSRLMEEIGLEGWDQAQGSQLLALHASASILGDVSQPIDGARRIASLSGDGEFRELVTRWDADPEGRADIDAEIRRAAVELFGEEETPDEA